MFRRWVKVRRGAVVQKGGRRILRVEKKNSKRGKILWKLVKKNIYEGATSKKRFAYTYMYMCIFIYLNIYMDIYTKF